MKIKHLALRVKDLEESIIFYKKITDLKVLNQKNEFGASLAFLGNDNGGTQIELICIPNSQTFEGKGFFVCFETDNLDQKHQEAVQLNLNPSPIQDPGDNTRYFYVYDPDGVSVQLRTFN